MLSFFKRLAGYEGQANGREFTSPLVLETPCTLIGDIHGRIDLLNRLLENTNLEGSGDLVFLGDYIDRGDESAAVLQRLFELDASDHVTCLMGNHEQMLIDFLDTPKERGNRWLRNGGLQTLASFGIGDVAEGSKPEILDVAAEKLQTKMGPELVSWLRNLPQVYQNGNLVGVHAGLDPNLPLALQKPSTYIWGHPHFFTTTRADGYWVAHGHTVVEVADAKEGRISIDTGAYYSGRLTAAVLKLDATIRFIDTE